MKWQHGARALLPALLASAFLIGIQPASAVSSLYTGGLSPTIEGQRADLNGDRDVDGADDSDAFYGDTSIIDGMLDCDAWSDGVNAGTAGSGAITAADDCTLVGYDGTADGVTIEVVDGQFATADGTAIATGTALPMTFNSDEPDDPSVVASQFGWSTIEGQVDSNGNGVIDAFDDTLGLIGSIDDVGFGDPTDGADVLANGCFGRRGSCLAIPLPLNGLVDLDSDGIITDGDSCSQCFFGRGLDAGYVTDGGGGGGGGGGEPTPIPPVGTHERTTSMSLGQQLVAAGTVSVADGTTECAANVKVDIQRRVHHRWRTVGTTRTDVHGAYRVHSANRAGKYRAKAPRTTLASGDICTRATSAPVWNRS